MKILIINKFLYPAGGAETYLLGLGRQLQAMGHRVEYFGMDHPDRVVGNRAEAYAPRMEFHGGRLLQKLTYPVRIIYSAPARRALGRVLEDLQPDVCLLNNFNFQLTPSVILEIRNWQRKTDRDCKLIYTAHDYQLVCPNHMCRNPGTGENCEKCLNGSFLHCIRGRCIHNSLPRSMLGALESTLWHGLGIYRGFDRIICCSRFLKTKLDRDPVLREKTAVLHNFVQKPQGDSREKQDYVLYFGRMTPEKGISDLLQAAAQLPHIPFLLAGSGPLEQLRQLPNVTWLGFQSGEDLKDLIRCARFTVCPSRWYENCPMSVLESISLGTPVLGADIGGIPELIRPGQTGLLFESGNAGGLEQSIRQLWEDRERLARMAEACRQESFDTPRQYVENLLDMIDEIQKEEQP